MNNINQKLIDKYAESYSNNIWKDLEAKFKINSSFWINSCEVSDIVEKAIKNAIEWYKKSSINELKYKIGDFVVDITFGCLDYFGEVGEIVDITENNNYIVKSLGNNYGELLQDGNEISEYYLEPWSFKFVRRGDFLCYNDGKRKYLFIVRNVMGDLFDVDFWYDVTKDTPIVYERINQSFRYDSNNITLVSEKDRKLLLDKLREVGYEWENGLKKIKTPLKIQRYCTYKCIKDFNKIGHDEPMFYEGELYEAINDDELTSEYGYDIKFEHAEEFFRLATEDDIQEEIKRNLVRKRDYNYFN